MEDFDDNFMRNSDLSELTGRFEKMLDDGTLLYYEVDDLDQLLDHYLIHHRLELAFKVIEITKSQYPSNRQMTIREAELLLLSDRKAEAVELLKEVENLESFNPDYHIICAQAHSQSGHYDDAVISLERALECSPEESDHIHLNIAIEYQNMENYSAAIDHLKKALNQNPNNEDALYELAYSFELTKNYDDAVSVFKRLIDQAPYNKHAWFNLGASYQATGDLEKALVAFDYVIVIDESFHAAYFNKANVLMQVERYADAIELYKKALAFEILDSLIYFYIGDCYDNLDDHKNALIYFEKALKKDDSMAEAWIGASSSLDMLNRELEALEYAKKALKIEPDNSDFWCFLAGLQKKYNLPIESIESYEKSIRKGYFFEDLWEEYAQLALTLNNNELAESVVDRGLLSHPDNTLLNLYSCIVQYRNNKEEEGFETLVELLIAEPTLIEEFILFYPKGMELKEIQFLIESLK